MAANLQALSASVLLRDITRGKLERRPSTLKMKVGEDDHVHPHVRNQKQTSFAAVLTRGDGACSLHAIFGHPASDKTLFRAGVRRLAVSLLGPSYALLKIRCASDDRLHPVVQCIWRELVMPFVLN